MKIVVAMLLVLVAVRTPAQDAEPAAARVAAAAVRRLLQAESIDEELLEKTAGAVLDGDRPAFADLARRLRAAERRPPTGARRTDLRRLRSLLERVGTGFLHRAAESEISYAGQYRDLAALQPFIGRVLLEMLLDPPQWFPETDRILIVPALRDLFPESPGDEVVERVRDVAEDEDFEVERLRLALRFLLAQWGDRELVQRWIGELEQRVDQGPADRVESALRELAHVRYELRDYVAAASTYRRLLRRGERRRHALTPADYYNAACSMSLSGDLDSALDELERCVKLMKSGTVDTSLMLKRKLFEKDPEIRAIRRTRRFVKLFKIAFGKPSGDRKNE